MSVVGRFEKLLDERVRLQGLGFEEVSGPPVVQRFEQLAEALSKTDRLRALCQDGFADRDRGFEYLVARLSSASPDRERAERAEAALAERTLQLAEVLFAASVRCEALSEGLAERDLRLAARESQWERQARSEALKRVELEEEVRLIRARLDVRTAQLAESLIAAQRADATMLEVLRVYGEAAELLRARLEFDRRAAIKSPNIARRLVGFLKERLPSPLLWVARAFRRRLERS